MTEIKESQKEIERRAYYDFLTEIPNRQLFLDRLKQAINKAKREELKVGALFIDLDNFKHINDSFGHNLGDLVLKEVAKRLTGCAREMDTVARLAGDEFAVILDDITAEEEAGAVASRILHSLSGPIRHKKSEVYTSVSVGIAIYPYNGKTPDEIIKNADMAMYHAKDRGKNNFNFFTESLNEKAVKRMKMETGLRSAIKDQHLIVYYQPKVELKSGKIVAMEALARWPQNYGEFVSPSDFIPLAETTGLIVLLDELILKKSCSFFKKIEKKVNDDFCISVNLSTKDLENVNLIRNILKTVKGTGLEPRHIELEVTESMIIRNVDSAIEILNKFKEEGFPLSIDDFGTGYSSLSYLAKFPLSTLKIDKSFVDDLESDEKAQSVATAIVQMAHAMNIKVVAEGVETEGQLDFLRSINCDLVQGFIFSKPISEEKMTALLNSGKGFAK